MLFIIKIYASKIQDRWHNDVSPAHEQVELRLHVLQLLVEILIRKYLNPAHEQSELKLHVLQLLIEISIRKHSSPAHQ